MRRYIKYMTILILFSAFISCKKLIDVGPPKTQLTPEKAFANDQSAVAVLSNIYAQFNTTAAIASKVTPLLGIYTDELLTTSSDASTLEFYNGPISITNPANLNIWKGLYSVIYQCNALLENIEVSPNVTSTIKQQLKGEALFLRAFSYFYLVNTYGDVPLLLSTDVRITASAPRSTTTQVYSRLTSDLEDAKVKLGDLYPSAEKVRANKWAAIALLARVYLYQQNWAPAESAATDVISSGTYSPISGLNSVFLKNSKESIFQFWTQNGFTAEGSLFVPSATSTPTYLVSSGLLNSFEAVDQRKTTWINSIVQGGQTYYYPFKYRNRTTTSGINGEYIIALRLSEQYLIRAEARAKQNNINGSVADLNMIRNRAGLPNTIANDQASLLAAIEQERKTEFFVEWGHRFYDLKRNGHLNQVMSGLKPAWRNTSALFPIPQYELLNNTNLTQNPGY